MVMKVDAVQINFFIGAFVIVGSILKGIFHVQHLRKTRGGNYDLSTEYTYSLPIVDKYRSTYKTIANWLVILIYLVCIFFLIINWKSILEAWEIISGMP